MLPTNQLQRLYQQDLTFPCEDHRRVKKRHEETQTNIFYISLLLRILLDSDNLNCEDLHKVICKKICKILDSHYSRCNCLHCNQQYYFVHFIHYIFTPNTLLNMQSSSIRTLLYMFPKYILCVCVCVCVCVGGGTHNQRISLYTNTIHDTYHSIPF
jgi:hypothetical protein